MQKRMIPAVTGLNHITLAVSNVQRSLAFYRDILGCTVRAVWPDGAYLEAGSLWLCLSRDDCAQSAHRSDYTHIAFSADDAEYTRLSARIMAECPIWKDNNSEGFSTYFLDPDGHKLEIHLGSLETRLRAYRNNPPEGMSILDVRGSSSGDPALSLQDPR